MGREGRIIIFTGKGGVGKTSIAAAHARLAAKQGRKTLMISTDMAHNLSDIFEVPLGKEVTKVEDNLEALEIDPNYEMENSYSSIMNAINQMFPKKVKIDIGENGMIFPGMEELFSLLKINEYYEKGEYDIIIVDCAPTGETLALLKFPELLSWYMEKLFPIGKVAMKVLRPISKTMFRVQLPDGEAMNDIERLYLKLSELQIMLKNREVTSIRLVTIPEKMVVEETKRSYMYMNLYNYNVDGLIINRVLPIDINNDFFDEWLNIQGGYIEELENIFGNIPVQKVKWYDMDINGMKALDRIVEDSLCDKNQLQVRMVRNNETFEKVGSGYRLNVYLPGVKKEDISMHQCEQELCLKIGNHKRNIPLPTVVGKLTVVSATYRDDSLYITLL